MTVKEFEEKYECEVDLESGYCWKMFSWHCGDKKYKIWFSFDRRLESISFSRVDITMEEYEDVLNLWKELQWNTQSPAKKMLSFWLGVFRKV